MQERSTGTEETQRPPANADGLEWHRRAAERSVVPIVITGGSAHHVRYANPAFRTLFATPAAEDPELRLSDLVRSAPELVALLDRTLRSGVAQLAPHLTCLDGKGARLAVMTIATPIGGDRLLVQLIDTAILDVPQPREQRMLRELTEANESLILAGLREQELAERANQRAAEIEALLSSMSEGVVVFDAAGSVVMLNASGRALFGLPEDAAPSEYRRVELCRRDGARLAFREHVLAPLLRGERIHDEELRLHQPDGSLRYLLFGASGVRDSDGRVRLAIEVFRDVTQLRELERMREQYLALISHDLRNPLAGASAAAQLLVYDAHSDRDRELARRIEHNLERMDEMLRDLLDVQRVRAGHELPLDLSKTDLTALAREIVNDLASVHGQRFELRGDERVIGIWSPAELRRAIANLLNNAIKYGATSRPITVTITKLPAGAVLSVHNEGPPISEEDQARLFAPFARAGATGDGRGWGLGLTLVRACAQAHGGEVRVRSEARSGTTFTLMLPLDSRPHQR